MEPAFGLSYLPYQEQIIYLESLINFNFQVRERTHNFQITNQTPYAFGHETPFQFTSVSDGRVDKVFDL